MNLNILHICTADNSGGAAFASLDLHHKLIELGVDSNYLILNKRFNWEESSKVFDHRRIYTNSIEKILHLYIKPYLLVKRSKWKLNKNTEIMEQISFPWSPFDITKDPKYIQADIIHLHWTSYFLDWKSFFKKNKKPIIWTLHDKNPFSGILHCSSKFPISLIPLEKEMEKLKAKFLENQTIKVVAPSEEYLKLSKESIILGKFPHFKIAHGVSFQTKSITKTKAREKIGWNFADKTVLTIASDLNRELKGFKTVLQKVRENPELMFFAIGSPPLMTENFSNLFFLGEINRDTLPLYYTAADLFLTASIEESFGLTIAESLVCGTPVMANLVGVFPELKQKFPTYTFTTDENLEKSIKAHVQNPQVINEIRKFFNQNDRAEEHQLLYKKTYQSLGK